MSERQERLQNRLQPEIREFRDGCRTLQLATVDGEGNPNASYAPSCCRKMDTMCSSPR